MHTGSATTTLASMASSSPPASRGAAFAIDDEAGMEAFVREHAGPGDMVVCLGAGTISGWTNALPGKLAKG